jgi:hypothetical protein
MEPPIIASVGGRAGEKPARGGRGFGVGFRRFSAGGGLCGAGCGGRRGTRDPCPDGWPARMRSWQAANNRCKASRLRSAFSAGTQDLPGCSPAFCTLAGFLASGLLEKRWRGEPVRLRVKARPAMPDNTSQREGRRGGFRPKRPGGLRTIRG